MSFLQKLIPFRLDKKQRIQEQTPGDINKHLRTREEEDFVYVYPSLSGTPSHCVTNDGDESADISKWEMAEILNPRNKSVVTEGNNNKNKTTKSTVALERLRHRYKNNPQSLVAGVATVTEDTRRCMEDSQELEMFDDKRNIELKCCRRRKYLAYNPKQ